MTAGWLEVAECIELSDMQNMQLIEMFHMFFSAKEKLPSLAQVHTRYGNTNGLRVRQDRLLCNLQDTYSTPKHGKFVMLWCSSTVLRSVVV